MSVTIRDIAKKCNCSITAVSLVLNNRPNRISEPVKQRIREAAKEFNYHPNQIALSLVTRKTNVIGLILPDISNAFFSEFVKEVESECSKHGYTLILASTNESAASELEVVRTFISRALAGIILIRSSIGLEEFQDLIFTAISTCDTPFICVDRSFKSGNIKNIIIDQKQGGYLATKHLISCGYKNIGMITGPLKLATAMMRLDGYKQALEEAHIPFNESFIYEGDFSNESGELGTAKLMEANVDAIFASNDMMAFGVYKAIHQMGLSIPDRLGVIGFDDIQFASIVSPSLTTIHQPMQEIANEAVNSLLDMIKGSSSLGHTKMFEPSLIIRGSTKKQ